MVARLALVVVERVLSALFRGKVLLQEKTCSDIVDPSGEASVFPPAPLAVQWVGMNSGGLCFIAGSPDVSTTVSS
jgi:hypothetical protein